MKLSRRDRRALTVGVAALAAAVGYVGVLKPLWGTRGDLEERRRAALEYLVRYRDIVANSSSLVAAGDSARARRERLAPLTYGVEPGSAMASLLDHVQRVAADSRVRMLRTSPVPGEPAAGGFQRIGVGLSCESDLAGLIDLLRALETGEKLVHVTRLRVEAVGEASSGTVQVLRFELTVEAFIDPEPTSAVIDAETPAP